MAATLVKDSVYLQLSRALRELILSGEIAVGDPATAKQLLLGHGAERQIETLFSTTGPDFSPATQARFDAVAIQCRDAGYLRGKAEVHNGLDYLQVSESDKPEPLWFIEDGPGGAITALLPSDY